MIDGESKDGDCDEVMHADSRGQTEGGSRDSTVRSLTPMT